MRANCSGDALPGRLLDRHPLALRAQSSQQSPGSLPPLENPALLLGLLTADIGGSPFASLRSGLPRLDMAQWYLYMIRTGNGSLYTGVATDVDRRLAEHRTGGTRCARYLRGKGSLRLVYKRRLGGLGLALRAERCIKRLRKLQKEQIVRSNPGRSELIARLGIRLREAHS